MNFRSLFKRTVKHTEIEKRPFLLSSITLKIKSMYITDLRKIQYEIREQRRILVASSYAQLKELINNHTKDLDVTEIKEFQDEKGVELYFYKDDTLIAYGQSKNKLVNISYEEVLTAQTHIIVF